MMGIEITAWLGAAYGVVLLLVAYGIDLLAKRAQKVVTEHKNEGFTYHEDHDAWLCPEDQWLWPKSFDPDNRVMRYRGSPTVCNSCPVKDSCTSSDDGREMRREVDSWPATESARFHRGIACAVVVLAAVWPLATALVVDKWAGQVLSLGTGILIAILSLPLWSHLRRSPAVPEGVEFRTADETVVERAEISAALARKRTTYASDRREEEHAS